MWIIIKFYNIIIKSVNVDKEEGETLIHKMWIKIVFFNPFLIVLQYVLTFPLLEYVLIFTVLQYVLTFIVLQ